MAKYPEPHVPIEILSSHSESSKKSYIHPLEKELSMSGERHHFIPRFLQKGFSSRQTKKDIYCWAFPKEEKPFQPNIKNVGIETLFYSIASETELDDKISLEEESIYSPLIIKLRKGIINNCDAIEISGMLAHFEIRSQHIRSNAKTIMSECAQTIKNILSNPSALDDLLTKIINPNSKKFKQRLLESGISDEVFMDLITTNPGFIEQCKQSIKHTIPIIFHDQRSTIIKSVYETIKATHIKNLNESLWPKNRLLRYSTLNYSIQNYPNNDLPLGDSIVLFNITGERKYTPFLDKSNELISVILPLSPNQYLIGTQSKGDIPQYSNLALEIARCSFEYFISSKNDQLAQSYQAEIGTNSFWLKSSEIQKIIADCFEEILEKQ